MVRSYTIHWKSKLITITSWWARCRLESPATRLFTLPFVQVQIKENIKASRHWPSWGESTGDWWIPLTKGQWRGNVSIWWRHHVAIWSMDNVSPPQLIFCGRPHFLFLKILLYPSWCRYKVKVDSNNVSNHKVTKSILVRIQNKCVPHYLPHLTHWGPEQMASFCRRHF